MQNKNFFTVVGETTVKQVYDFVLDQCCDPVDWNTLVTFGATVVGIERSRIECAIGDLLNSRRLNRNRDGKLETR